MGKMEFQHHPLQQWPREETPLAKRTIATFKANLQNTLKKLAYELSRINAINPILVTTDHQQEHQLRIDGLPREEQNQPRRTGIILEFYVKKNGEGRERERMQYASDRYTKWQSNLRAIALTLESLRAVDRYGATAAGEQYAGFKSIPAPTAKVMSPMEAASVLAALPGTTATAKMIFDSKQIFLDSYRIAARKAHPDSNKGRDHDWKQLQISEAILRAHHHL